MKASLAKILYPGMIQLQEMGWVPAKPASEFKIGELIMWNYGHKSRIVRISQKTHSTLVFTVESNNKIYTFERRVKTLTAIG